MPKLKHVIITLMVIKKYLLFLLLIEIFEMLFVELYMRRGIHKKNVYSTSLWSTAIRFSQ